MYQDHQVPRGLDTGSTPAGRSYRSSGTSLICSADLERKNFQGGVVNKRNYQILFLRLPQPVAQILLVGMEVAGMIREGHKKFVSIFDDPADNACGLQHG
jgi:hypothetical protein